ncbi:MAG: 50S ribosomal protein L4 [Desulfurococcales archaeon]|nr:50S ribosomal protein L4 [Desulfurococcales archaeon]
MYSSLFLYLREPVSAPVYDVNGSVLEEITLPDVFRVPVRKDLIRRAYYSEFTAKLQPKGRDPMAGKRTSARSLGAHHGVSRVPRIRGSMRAALVNMTRGGRLAHPPRVEKRIHEEINRVEKRIATMSALAATSIVDLVRGRGHRFSVESLPVILDSGVLDAVSKVSQAKELLEKIGVYDDVLRARSGKRWRAGKGKMRGRRYKQPVSILFIVENHRSPFALSVKGLPGVSVAEPWNVGVIHLAPGGEPGRLTVITRGALDQLKARFRVIAP